MLAIGDDGYRPIESSVGLPGLSAARIDAFFPDVSTGARPP